MEAVIVMAQCPKTHGLYGIRTQKERDGSWLMTWSFKLDNKKAAAEGYDRSKISGAVYFSEKYPGCPYCGTIGWVKCGKCGMLSCYGAGANGENPPFKCPKCGNGGNVEVAERFDLTSDSF